MAVTVHNGDLPKELALRLGEGGSVAVDTETMGLLPGRDRLCLVQLSAGDGDAHVVRFDPSNYRAPRLVGLLADERVTKLFHFARFDVAVLKHYLGVTCVPIYCTKIASRLARTFTDRHSLKDLCKEVLGIELSKEQQSSDWGAAELTAEQLNYAASDVLHLHQIRARLDEMLAREGRSDLAAACFEFLPTRALLDLAGWRDSDIFAH
jgi:ribonuclease D